ncbi:MAG: electron transfer flavoprotein subunit beta/FixA family protein [Dehalococcoidia bacterium]|nr:electron transfer flavoprotein subunit beta/FixA family protein [Dehalococcoidia bacterium]
MTGELNMLVCLKVVPKSEEVGVNRETMTLDRGNARSEINPPDMNALEAALALKDRYGGRVSLLSMGPPFVVPMLRVGLAMGADAAYLLSDRAFGGADTLATSLTLASAIRKIGNIDLVLCGEESSDGATAQVPPGIAAWLDIPQVTYAMDVELDRDRRHLLVTREIRGGEEVLDAPMPAVVSLKVSCNQPRFMDAEGISRLDGEVAVTTWTASDLDVDPAHLGLAGSPTSVAGLREASQQTGRRREMVTGTPEQEAHVLYERISEFLRSAGPRAQEVTT